MKDFFRNLWEYFFAKYNGVTDEPSVRDFIEPKTPKGIDRPRQKDLLETAIETHYQNTKVVLNFPTQTKNACSAYAAGDTKRITCLNKAGQDVLFNHEYQWTMQELEEGAGRDWGCSLQGACNVAKHYPQGAPIMEYRRIDKNDTEEVLYKIASGNAIYTGISWKVMVDWKSNYLKMLATGIWEWVKSKLLGGHAVTLVGYNDDTQLVKAFEPMRKKWGINIGGVFYIPYDNLKYTMSQYIFYVTRPLEN